MTETGQESETVSDLVARRIQQLRKDQGMASAARLAAECSRLGAPEVTTNTIANIESGRRDSDGRRRRDVTVDELLAISAALGVPPVALLVHPQEEHTPIIGTIAVPPVEALLWMLGEVMANPAKYGAWSEATIPVRLVRRFHQESTAAENALGMLRHPEMPEDRRDSLDKALSHDLSRLSRTLAEMRQIGMTLPDVQPMLVDEARQRGVWNQEQPTALVADARRGGAWEADRG